MSVIVDIAEAVVSELNAAGSPIDGLATAVRSYRPQYDLSQMRDLHVTVVPRSIAMQAADRARSQQDIAIDVAVQKKLEAPPEPPDATPPDPSEQDEIDGLMDLVQKVADHFRQYRLLPAANAVWVSTANEPVYAIEHLEHLRGFTSVLTLTYRVMRPPEGAIPGGMP